MPHELIVYILALIPVVERTAIIIGIVKLDVTPMVALPLGILGNLTPVVPLLLFLEPVSNWISKKISLFERFFNYLFEHTRRRHSHKMDRYGIIGIFITAAIPAPGMGPWSASLVAFIFGTDFWPAFIAIIAGTVVAGLIFVAAALGLIALTNLGSPLISSSIILLLIILGVMIWRNQKK